MYMSQTLKPRGLFMRIMTKVRLIAKYKLPCRGLQGEWVCGGWELGTDVRSDDHSQG